MSHVRFSLFARVLVSLAIVCGSEALAEERQPILRAERIQKFDRPALNSSAIKDFYAKRARVWRRSKATDSGEIAEFSDKYFAQILSAYGASKYAKHARLSSALLRFHAQHPQLLLHDTYDKLIARIRRDGAAPYLSFVLEFIYRSSFAPTKRSDVQVKGMMQALSRGKAVKARGLVLARTADRRHLRPYSASVGTAALAVMTAEYQDGRFRSSYAPETYLWITGKLQRCKRAKDDDDNDSTDDASLAACQRLLDVVAESVDSHSNPKVNLDQVLSDIDGGVVTGHSQCVESLGDSTFQGMIDQFDQFRSCVEDQTPSGSPRFDPFGSLFEGIDPNEWYARQIDPEGTKEALEQNLYEQGYEKKTQKLNFVTAPEGVGLEFEWVMYADDTWEKTDPDTGRTTEVHISQTTDTRGNVHTTQRTNHETDHGGHVTSYIYFENGMPTEGGYYDIYTGESYTAKYNENGTLKEERFVDEDGKETVVKYDEDGNCIKNCESTGAQTETESSSSETSDRYGNASCAATRLGKLGEIDEQDIVSSLDILIYPAPDTVQPSDNPCFTQFEAEALNQCESVMMCIGGAYVNANCTCTFPGELQVPAEVNSQCLYTNCGANECDPATGMCRTGTGPDDVLPGEVSPAPAPYVKQLGNSVNSAHKSVMIERLRRLGTVGDRPGNPLVDEDRESDDTVER